MLDYGGGSGGGSDFPEEVWEKGRSEKDGVRGQEGPFLERCSPQVRGDEIRGPLRAEKKVLRRVRGGGTVWADFRWGPPYAM